VRSNKLVNIENPASWPDDLVDYLEEHRDLYMDWETGPTTTRAWQYDRFMYGLRDVLQPYSLTGWHCTRLTDVEILVVQRTGMQLPDRATLFRRIDAVVRDGLLAADIGTLLKGTNQAGEEYRAGRIYFCFFPPRADGDGVADFFRYWGGEALYNSHENNPLTGMAIASIGVPCIVEAEVPIAFLRSHSFLEDRFARRYAVSRGLSLDRTSGPRRCDCPSASILQYHPGNSFPSARIYRVNWL
jgi:hypothetical protein